MLPGLPICRSSWSRSACVLKSSSWLGPELLSVKVSYFPMVVTRYHSCRVKQNREKQAESFPSPRPLRGEWPATPPARSAGADWHGCSGSVKVSYFQTAVTSYHSCRVKQNREEQAESFPAPRTPRGEWLAALPARSAGADWHGCSGLVKVSYFQTAVTSYHSCRVKQKA